VESQIKLYLNSTIVHKYDDSGIDTNGTADIDSGSMITIAWNLAQLTFECCGVEGYEDYELAQNWNNEYDMGSNVSLTVVVPPTCCRLNGTTDLSITDIVGMLSDISYVDLETCLTNATANSTYQEGCYPTIKAMLISYALYIGTFALVIGIIEIAAVITAFCLVKSFDRVEPF